MMAGMPRSLSASECLDDFFADRRRGATGHRLAGVDRAERVLRTTVERTAELVLTDDEQLLVHAERQFGAEGAVARVMPAAGLLLVLEAYLAHLEVRPSRTAARRIELDTCAALTRHLARELRHLDVLPATHRIELALEGCGAVSQRSAGPRRLLKALGLA
ncbi:hypothetical protein GCM10025783_10820 [Amnibacterium soli]|uniref:DUF222 domain-containing protein n=2 Tax=Amnibacterium soli TaxID=1282736 RepID=A0ABP8Z059_9MICO